MVIRNEDISRFKKAQTIVENYIIDGLEDGSSGLTVKAVVITMTGVIDGDWRAVLTSSVDHNIYNVVYLSKLKTSRLSIFTPSEILNIQDDVD